MASNDILKARERILAGVLRFQEEIFPREKAKYQKTVLQGQKPHTLFITCADSRIDPELITQSGPGEIFVSRNIGNLVPTYGEVLGGVSAIIEYAVEALRVCRVVVCGHSDCGAMFGLLHPERIAQLPAVKTWLRNGEAALSIVRRRSEGRDEHTVLEQLTEQNVLLQLNHLRTHPSIAGRLADGSLELSGWIFDIGQGIVRIHDEALHKFLPVTIGQTVS
jgi:carbonic anhydrase